jgi:hypothetical protein
MVAATQVSLTLDFLADCKFRGQFGRLSMNGRNYNDFKMATVRPEPVEGCSSLFTKGSIVIHFD